MSVGFQSQRGPSEGLRIDELRARYEDRGFRFTAAPDVANLPEFFGSYVPEALAQKAGQNIAIEIKHRVGETGAPSLTNIRRLFEGRPDWRFDVVYLAAEPQSWLTIAAPRPAEIADGVAEIRELAAQGHRRAALVMAWSLLEAALRSLHSVAEDRPYTAGEVVQTLAMYGYVEPETESRLRGLVNLRNRVAHGDLAADPGEVELELILSAIDERLKADAS